jgi:uncharacterized membrane protein
MPKQKGNKHTNYFPSNQQNAGRAMVSQSKHELTIHSGPVPSPEILEHYEQILPGAADRIIKMAETQMHHRHLLESNILKGNNRDSLLGIIFAFIISITITLGGTFVIYHGHGVAGTLLSGTGVAGLVSAFIYGTRSGRKNNDKNDY